MSSGTALPITATTSRTTSLADAPRTSIFRPFPIPQTPRQWFYLLVLQGVGAGFIDGGANFGIAYAMYHGQDVVKMWVFSKNTIAGDLGVTPIIQCLASMLITSTLVHTDLHHNAIKPLPFVYPHVEHLPDPRTFFQRTRRPVVADPEKRAVDDDDAPTTPRRGIAFYYWMLVRFIFEGTEKNMMLARVGVGSWFGRLLWTAAQGAGVGIVFGFPIWCLAIVILGPIYGNGNMGSKWAPQVIKLVYGAIVGWVTNPVIAVLALGSQAEHHLVLVDAEGVDGDASGAAVDVEAGQAVPTIHEEDEMEVMAPPSIRADSTASVPGSPVAPSLRRPPTLGTPATPLRALRPRGNTASSARSPLPSPTMSARPPLVANASQLAVAPPLSARPTRPRGATVSTVVSARSLSYALGGTGGRARRPRADTTASAREVPQVEAGSLTAPTAQSTFGTGTPQSLLFQGRTRSATAASTQQGEAVAGERPAVWDVFGRTDGSAASEARPRRSSDGALLDRPR